MFLYSDNLISSRISFSYLTLYPRPYYLCKYFTDGISHSFFPNQRYNLPRRFTRLIAGIEDACSITDKNYFNI